jgi:hypothetical protein
MSWSEAILARLRSSAKQLVIWFLVGLATFTLALVCSVYGEHSEGELQRLGIRGLSVETKLGLFLAPYMPLICAGASLGILALWSRIKSDLQLVSVAYGLAFVALSCFLLYGLIMPFRYQA